MSGEREWSLLKEVSPKDGQAAAIRARKDDFVQIVPPPKVASDPKDLPPRSDDGEQSVKKVERGFISPPPKVLPPPSKKREFSMSGKQEWSSLKVGSAEYDRGAPTHARRNAFIKIVPPPNVAADHPAIAAHDARFEIITPPPKTISGRDFDPVASAPKTDTLATKIFRRIDIWTNGFIGNVINKWTKTSPTKSSISSGLTSYQQNGASRYGTLDMAALPKYYGGGSSTPWGTISTTNANPYKSCPQTGETRNYEFSLAECNIRPDGVETKKAICVNGQFPGPLIEANYGDMIEVKVTNRLHDEGTSMHWHGFLQTGMNEMDGVPGVTQCPIAPGDTMVYRFRAELYGTAW